MNFMPWDLVVILTEKRYMYVEIIEEICQFIAQSF